MLLSQIYDNVQKCFCLVIMSENINFQPTVLTVALLVQCCLCRLSSSSSVTLCIVAKRCVLQQKLLL